jgi:hypothetical protein
VNPEVFLKEVESLSALKGISASGRERVLRAKIWQFVEVPEIATNSSKGGENTRFNK